jgi:hypothetical protein
MNRDQNKVMKERFQALLVFAYGQLMQIYHQHVINKQGPKQMKEKFQALLVFA